MSYLFDNLIDSIGENNKGTLLRSVAIFIVMELCGSFLTGKVGPSTTKLNFVTFCKSKYMPSKYHGISELLYSIFRNGVSHTYLAKGAAHLSSDPEGIKYHLAFSNDGIFIYVPSLAKDVKVGLESLKEDIFRDASINNNYYHIFKELYRSGKEEYSKFVIENNIQTQDLKTQGDIIIDNIPLKKF